MSDAVATRTETASPSPSKAPDERQGQLLDKVVVPEKVSAVAGTDTALPPLKAGPQPWEGALLEARSSVQSLDSHIKAEMSGPRPASEPTLADAGNRVKAALDDVWKDPYLSFTLKAQGESQDTIKTDLAAGRFEKVVATLQKTETTLHDAQRKALDLPTPMLDKPAQEAVKVERTNAETVTPAEQAPAAAKPEATTPHRPGSSGQQDPIVELVQRLKEASVAFSDRDAGLARGINRLAETATADPTATSQALFRTQVAYSLQDTEKALGPERVSVPAELRSEMTRLAGTSPGLENRQMEALVRSTPEIDDRGLVRDLRLAAKSIATMGENQNSTAVQQHVDVLENRVRLAPRVAASEAAGVVADRPAPPQAEATAGVTVSREAAPATRTPTGPSSDQPPAEVTVPARVAASPGDGQQRPEKYRENEPAPVQGMRVVGTESRPKTAMAQIMDNLRSRGPSSPPPWAPSAFAMGDRVTKFEQMLGQGKTDQLIRASEKSGVALMKSIETFSTGPGAEILGKIDAAAGTEPGGMKAVMREMQPGGRYAELRTQFDNALQSDRAFAASYNQVEKTAGQHGKDRLALGADFEAKGLDVRQLDARFQKADEAIGEATERIPGRTPGKSAMEELGQKVAEIFNKAIERVRAMFGREAAPEARASTSPSMSP